MLKRMITRKLAMAAKELKHVDVAFLLLISRISSAESTSPKCGPRRPEKVAVALLNVSK